MAQAVRSDGIILGFKWEDAATGVQHTIAKVGATHGGCAMATAITDIPLGILLNAPTEGAAASVQMTGKCLVVGDGTTDIAIGDLLCTDSTGRAIKTAVKGSYETAAEYIIGYALQACVEPNYIFEVMLRPQELGQ